MRVIQLTDSHVSADPGARYRGFDPRACLESLLEPVRAWGPELVLVTGDLSEDGSSASYAWLAGTLSCLGVPVLAIPGNHDDPQRMRSHFVDCAVASPLALKEGGWQLVLLNSAVEGEVPGRLGEALLKRLDRTLAESELPKLIALHHQPLPVGSAWIDRYPLLEPENLWDVLDRHPGVRAVAWGHVHHAIEMERNGVQLLGSPSTVCNSLPGQERFTLDPAGPACRWFELRAGGNFHTGVLDAGRLSRIGAERSRG